MTLKVSTAALTLIATLYVASGSAMAAEPGDTAWQKNHPRRDQVNDRLVRQNHRIRTERKEGEITPAQAAELHQDVHQIRLDERAMASQNGGHITREQQKELNQEANKVSREIGR